MTYKYPPNLTIVYIYSEKMWIFVKKCHFTRKFLSKQTMNEIKLHNKTSVLLGVKPPLIQDYA